MTQSFNFSLLHVFKILFKGQDDETRLGGTRTAGLLCLNEPQTIRGQPGPGFPPQSCSALLEVINVLYDQQDSKLAWR